MTARQKNKVRTPAPARAAAVKATAKKTAPLKPRGPGTITRELTRRGVLPSKAPQPLPRGGKAHRA
jgi:hypothetical protein